MSRGVKYDDGKPRFDLIPVLPLEELAKLYGWAPAAGKYPERNWELGMDWSKMYRAIFSHVTKWWNGEKLDEESGCHHLAAVAFSAFALMEYEFRKTGRDNRPQNPQVLTIGQKLERALFENSPLVGYMAATENIEKFPQEGYVEVEVPDALGFKAGQIVDIRYGDTKADLSATTSEWTSDEVGCPECHGVYCCVCTDHRDHEKGVYRKYKCKECDCRFWTLDYAHVTEFPNFDAVVPAIDKTSVEPVPEGRVIGGPAVEEFDKAIKEKRPLRRVTKAKKWNDPPTENQP